MGRNTATTVMDNDKKILSMRRGSTRQVLRMHRALRHSLTCLTCTTHLAMTYILAKDPSYAVNYVQPGLNYIQMLCKEFSLLNDDDWRDCSKDTNAVERKNRDSKMTNTASLRSLQIALYKSDKSCAYQYMAAIRSGDLTYNRTGPEARLKSAKV